MFVRLVLWDLDGADVTIEQLRDYLRDESVDVFDGTPGLRLKLWVSDAGANTWGAVYLWESRGAVANQPPSRARDLIGKDPDLVREFDLEASIEGTVDLPELSRRGLAFEAK
jgi:hypothetical protein